MTDVPVDRTDLPTDPYRPFPRFEDFRDTDFDASTVHEFVGVLESVRDSATPEQLSSAVDRATRWAAVDTGAIEGLYDVDRGFTLSVAAEAAAWDNMHLVVGDAAARSIHDALRAYEFVLDVVTESHPITETWIKELHEVICASQETYTVLTAVGKQEHKLPKGKYKDHPNNPFNLRAGRIHEYAPVTDTPAEMHRLVTELATPEFIAADPVVQAAYAHYAFVCIHPFADGNGRVARAIASVFLYRSPGVPLVIFVDQKLAYLDTLEAADAGNYGPFVSFVADRAIDVIQMIAADARRTPRRSVPELQEHLQSALVGRDGLLHEEVDALALRALGEWIEALRTAAGRVEPAGALELSIETDPGLHVTELPAEYRFEPGRREARLQARTQGPAPGFRYVDYRVAVAKGQSDRPDFVVVDQHGRIVVDAFIRDLKPATSAPLRYRLDVAAEDEVNAVVDQLVSAVADQLRKSGYAD